MAEGPDPPGQTSAKCELVSALMNAQGNVFRALIPFTVSIVYIMMCDLAASPPTASDAPTLKELSNALDPVADWYSLGVKLGLEDHELRTIEQNYRGDRCKLEMLSRWLRSAKLPTWKAVADAVQLMGEHKAALKILNKHCIASGNTTGMCPVMKNLDPQE